MALTSTTPKVFKKGDKVLGPQYNVGPGLYEYVEQFVSEGGEILHRISRISNGSVHYAYVLDGAIAPIEDKAFLRHNNYLYVIPSIANKEPVFLGTIGDFGPKAVEVAAIIENLLNQSAVGISDRLYSLLLECEVNQHR